MAIILRLDRIMADRKVSLTELSERVGISMANLSNLKTGKVEQFVFLHWMQFAGSFIVSRETF